MANGPYNKGGGTAVGPYNAPGGKPLKPGKPIGPYNRPIRPSIRVTRAGPMRAIQPVKLGNPGHTLANMLGSVSAQGIKQIQTGLNHNGYNVTIDGLVGPQTISALKAYNHGIHPNVWHLRQAIASGHPTIKAAVANVVRPTKPQRNQAAAPLRAPASPMPALPRIGGGGLGGLPPDQFIDPAAYATSAVGAEYGPAIGELQRSIRQGGAQGAQNQADISSWFKQVMGTQAQGQAFNQKALADALARNQSSFKGISDAFGNLGTSDLPNLMANAQTALSAQGATEDTFDNRMKTLLAAEGAEAHVSQKNRDAASLAELTGKLTDMRTAKGQAYAKALQDAYQLRGQQRTQAIQNASAQQALALARGMAPYQIAGARQDLRTKGQLATLQAQQLQTNIKTAKAQLSDFMTGSTGDLTPFSGLDIKSRLSISGIARDALKPFAAAHGGKPGKAGRSERLRAWGTVKNLLSPYDTTDPQVRSFALGILKSVYPNVKHPEVFK